LGDNYGTCFSSSGSIQCGYDTGWQEKAYYRCSLRPLFLDKGGNNLVGVVFLGTAGLLAETSGAEGFLEGDIWIYYRRGNRETAMIRFSVECSLELVGVWSFPPLSATLTQISTLLFYDIYRDTTRLETHGRTEIRIG
jgi:hypothetical protein